MSHWFAGRRLVVATKHQKERVIAPLVESALGVRCLLPDDLDTDQLGTFSGEVDRTLDPLETARQKGRMAMDLTGCDLAIASEGAFGPHPHLFFTAADDEVLLLMDRKHDLEIFVRVISTETNFAGAAVATEEELLRFAAMTRFPSHALILRSGAGQTAGLLKGITTYRQLLPAFHALQATFGAAYVETDMRAMHNPMRMKVIEAAAQKLIARVQSHCPHCDTPGFGRTDVKTGLPCGLCGLPTRSVLADVYRCQRCGHTEERSFPRGQAVEDPMYCDFCNP
ncbi:hypothetical protein DYU11_10025 [Fibrisoma montanum]|uniref:DUF6671 domain-containing protein n=2 Tax=Fibrisoma montanum TaxID=2305895 RepID=A0A418MCH6_9BACT|nr:hypothetical protein DYU11_10025 [Fibrisoma montanum]